MYHLKNNVTGEGAAVSSLKDCHDYYCEFMAVLGLSRMARSHFDSRLSKNGRLKFGLGNKSIVLTDLSHKSIRVIAKPRVGQKLRPKGRTKPKMSAGKSTKKSKRVRAK